MSNFVPSIKYTTQFEKDEVFMELSSLKTSDMAKLAPYMKEEGQPSTVESMEIMRVGGELLPGYVDNFSGLFDANGSPVSFETVLEQVYFIELVSDIMAKLFDISRMSPDQDLNSEGRPNTPTEEPELSEAN